MITVFIIAAIWLALGIFYLWFTIEYANYKYDNSLQAVAIVMFWLLALMALIVVSVFGKKIFKNMDIDEKQKDEFKHL